jgi:hypothetical protein
VIVCGSGRGVTADALVTCPEIPRRSGRQGPREPFRIPPFAPGHERPGVINHSGDPNCGLADSFVVTLRAIAAGEELTTDHASSSAGDVGAHPDSVSCRCGTARCRGRHPLQPAAAPV